MTIKNMLIKELGSLVSKAASAGGVGSLFGAHRPDDSSTSAASAAWKEIEHKLQGLFSHDDESNRKAAADKKRRTDTLAIGIVGVLAVVFLFGRRSGRRGTSVLEVHRS